MNFQIIFSITVSKCSYYPYYYITLKVCYVTICHGHRLLLAFILLHNMQFLHWFDIDLISPFERSCKKLFRSITIHELFFRKFQGFIPRSFFKWYVVKMLFQQISYTQSSSICINFTKYNITKINDYFHRRYPLAVLVQSL